MEELNAAIQPLSSAYYEAKTRQNGNGNSAPAPQAADLGKVTALEDPGPETAVGTSGFDPDAESRINMDELLKEGEASGAGDFRDV